MYPDLQLMPDGDGKVETYVTKSLVNITTFSLTTDGKELVVNQRKADETECKPTEYLSEMADSSRIGINDLVVSQSERHFDENGVEQERVEYQYDNLRNDHNGMLSQLLHESQGKIQDIKMDVMPTRYLKQVRVERYSRNDDGTMHVTINDQKRGSINIEQSPISDQYNTGQLIPDSGAITAAFEAASNKSA